MTSIRIAVLWPGLAAAWYRGHARGLLYAVLFAWVVSLLLLATFVWPTWLAGWLVASIWLVIGGYWLFEVVRCQFTIDTMLENVSQETDQDFTVAQKDYLQGNWFEAEARLLQIAAQQPHDVAAGLLLVGVLRHTGRPRPALRRLEQICLLDASREWQFEIHRERQFIENALSANKGNDVEIVTEEQGEESRVSSSRQD